MPNSIVAVADGEFRFDPSVVFDTLRAVWPATTFNAASGRVATVSAGQIVVNDGEALVEVTVAGQGLDIDWRAPEVLAEVVSVITSIPGFAAGSTVILADWAWVLPILHEGMSADDLLTIRRDGADTQVPSYEP
ncbi:hypothetical protein [Cellulomonas wangsupingiae]|uniref:Uncharacterized protein n=1 Tax=Cellulomonas wangsupingiae TaxID=2968085 RepID=A0ABY5K820_9CELL|nr:hypothetical protein [Cellulomonas wangsupingiae]MCC2335047.1 hypothetical protein [Cellulomonas wangsupingiae]MCM0638917.1 hypothetical protein [Cellulomonas wangsupingiae]UUI65546.1 hypothetical protein NP075_02040 [Cellulomonas wangsupingiae]